MHYNLLITLLDNNIAISNILFDINDNNNVSAVGARLGFQKRFVI